MRGGNGIFWFLLVCLKLRGGLSEVEGPSWTICLVDVYYVG
jgi:hypothetical protein